MPTSKATKEPFNPTTSSKTVAREGGVCSVTIEVNTTIPSSATPEPGTHATIRTVQLYALIEVGDPETIDLFMSEDDAQKGARRLSP
jgi:hypothetical protein